MFDKLTPEEKRYFSKFVQLLLAEKPYLLSIDNEVTKLNNGVMQFTLRVYGGKVTDFLMHNTKRMTFNNAKEQRKTN